MADNLKYDNSFQMLSATSGYVYTSLLDFVGHLYILDANFAIIVPTIPNDANQSAGTAMTTFELYFPSIFTDLIWFLATRWLYRK